ncbi:MAG: hypothetical protein WBQ78_06410, partial [Gammaproteobacteria bacterium]
MGLLVGIALFSTSSFCADPDSPTIMDPAAGQSTEAIAEEAVKKAVEKAVEESVGQAVEKSVGQAAEKAVEKSVGQAVEKAAEKAVEKVAEEAVGKAVEKAAEEAAIQAEQTARRPDEWKGPTRVHFLVFLIDVDAIDDANQNFTANVYIRLRWEDRRLAKPGAAVRQIPLESVWSPRVLLANQTGIVTKSLPDVVQVEANGTVTYHQRYTGKLSQPMHLSEFPRDRHTFFVQFVATGYSDDHLEFVPDDYPFDNSIRGGSIADELSLTDWKVLGYEALPLTYRPIKAIHTAGFGLRFEAERQFAYYLWQIVLPMGVVVVMSWAAFWVGRENIGVRIGVATSSVLTLIANRFVFASLLPRLPYMTRMDYFTVGSTLLVFLALVMVVMIAFLETRQRERFAARLDLFSRGAFPA